MHLTVHFLSCPVSKKTYNLEIIRTITLMIEKFLFNDVLDEKKLLSNE